MAVKEIEPVEHVPTWIDGLPYEVESAIDLYTAEQMQEYAKVERDYIIVIDGGFGTKTYAKNRFTGVVVIDIYGDQYKVTNHIHHGKKWVLQEAQDEKVHR